MNETYLVLKLAYHKCLINLNHYFILVLIIIVLKSVQWVHLLKPAHAIKGGGRGKEGTVNRPGSRRVYGHRTVVTVVCMS